MKLKNNKICGLCGKEFLAHGRAKYCGSDRKKNGCSYIMRHKRTKEWVENNRERRKELNRNFHSRHPEKYLKSKENFRRNNKIKRLSIRFIVLQKDDFTCQYCGRKAPEVALEIDHKYPKSKGGLDKIENYITSCRDCNIGKGDCILNEFS